MTNGLPDVPRIGPYQPIVAGPPGAPVSRKVKPPPPGPSVIPRVGPPYPPTPAPLLIVTSSGTTAAGTIPIDRSLKKFPTPPFTIHLPANAVWSSCVKN